MHKLKKIANKLKNVQAPDAVIMPIDKGTGKDDKYCQPGNANYNAYETMMAHGKEKKRNPY